MTTTPTSNTPPPKNLPAKRMGQGMLILIWIGVLVVLVWFWDHWEGQRINPNQAPQSLINEQGDAEVVLQRNAYNHYVMTGKVNGQSVTFMLDTGATQVAIPEPLARELNLPIGPLAHSLTANGRVAVRMTRIAELEIGNIYFTNVSAAVLPNMPGDEILLGMSALKQIDFQQIGDQLILRQKNGEHTGG